MKDKLEYNLRCGKHLNIVTELEEIEANYKVSLKATLYAFDTYNEVSEETYNDYVTVCAVLDTYERMGYLEHEETDAIKKEAEKERINTLSLLEEKEGEN